MWQLIQNSLSLLSLARAQDELPCLLAFPCRPSATVTLQNCETLSPSKCRRGSLSGLVSVVQHACHHGSEHAVGVQYMLCVSVGEKGVCGADFSRGFSNLHQSVVHQLHQDLQIESTPVLCCVAIVFIKDQVER